MLLLQRTTGCLSAAISSCPCIYYRLHGKLVAFAGILASTSAVVSIRRILCLCQLLAIRGILFFGLSMTVYEKFVNTISHKPLVEISPNLQLSAFGDKDELIRV